MSMARHEIDLFSLPYDLQLPVIKKLTFQEFCRLSRCSRLSYELCYSRKFKLRFHVNEIVISQDKEEVLIGTATVPLDTALSSPARIFAANFTIKNILTEELCVKLIDSFVKGKVSAKKMTILERPECQPDTLAALLKTLRVVRMETSVNLGAAFFEHDVFLELEDIALRCNTCSCLVHFQVKRAALITHPQRPTAQVILRNHIDEEWTPMGGHLTAY